MNDRILLDIKNIFKRYKSKNLCIEALKGVNLQIMRGEIISLLGVNGAGKTTLSSIIATLHPASSGDILMDGVSIYNDVVSYRRGIGLCPQSPNIDMGLTLEENLRFAGLYYGLDSAKIEERTAYLMKRFGMEKYAKSQGNVLSGGYKQRFMIARALMHEPRLVILDEPTVGLDPHIRRDIWEVIKDLKNDGTTVLLTTHYLDEAEKLSDRVCVLDRGVIQLIDTPENLKKAHGQSNLEDVFVKLIKESEADQQRSL